MPILREAIKGKKTISYIKKQALCAHKCDNCGLIFKMDKYCNDNLEPGRLKGTFSTGAIDRYGKGMGNMFFAIVCSFKCADEIFNDGWKKMKEYKPYIKTKAVLVRAELGMTSLIKTEEELITEWENKKED